MSYPSPSQRAALDRAIHAIEDEARFTYLAGDARGEEAATQRALGETGLADALRRDADRKRRQGKELQRTADELSAQFPEEGP